MSPFLAAVMSVTAVLVLSVAVLAGFVIARHTRNQRRSRQAERDQARWEPFILDLLLEDEVAETVTSVVGPKEGRRFLRSLLQYAQRVSGADRARLVSASSPFLWDLREDLDAGRPETRARAVQLLAELGFDDHVPAIVNALDDSSALVRMVAAHALTRPGYSGLAGAVVDRIDRFSSWDRGFLAGQLALSGPGLAPRLRDLLGDPTAPYRNRAIAADALRLLNDPLAADVAAGVLAGSEDPELSAACLRLLGQVGRPVHAAHARPFARSDRFPLRAHALTVLGSLGTDEDLEVLEEAIFSDSPWVALHAGRALVRMGRTEALGRLADSQDPRRDLALEVLSA